MEESDKKRSALLKGEDASGNNAPLESNAGSESFYLLCAFLCSQTRQIPSCKRIVEHCTEQKAAISRTSLPRELREIFSL